MNDDKVKVHVTTTETDNQPRVISVMVSEDGGEIMASHDEKAVYPNYTEFWIYKALVNIAENAGIAIKYSDKKELADDENTIGSSSADEYANRVSMTKDHDYGTFEHAAFILAHEIAHTLTKELYSDAASHFYDDKMHIRRFFEADADKIGTALYTLAEMTAMYEAESIWCDKPADK